MTTTTKLRQILTVANIQTQNVTRINFKNEWYQAFGNPQDKGVWFVWGSSGSGKSAFVMMLAKQNAESYKTLYNVLEESTDDSDYIERTVLFNMNEVEDKFYAIDYNYEELMQYIVKRNRPKVLIIDSITYLIKTWEQYIALKKLCMKHEMIMIIVGHAEGKHPKTQLEKDIRFDAKMKIFISGYLATCQGRTIGPNGGQFIIWKEGYDKINGATVSI